MYKYLFIMLSLPFVYKLCIRLNGLKNIILVSFPDTINATVIHPEYSFGYMSMSLLEAGSCEKKFPIVRP